jgi:hypothetical protein
MNSRTVYSYIIEWVAHNKDYTGFQGTFRGRLLHCQEKIIRRGGLYRDGLIGIGDWDMVS